MKTIRVFLGLSLLGIMLATTVPSFAAPQHGKKSQKKGGKSGKGSQKKGGGRGSSK
jgi:hypothetical protein